ncbi:MAG: fumarylacetoacetate hydrolase family protein [Proteobacteria bacterium]|nr:fumarylacetoacetate hydrolase family protein [Pseudomonadota bacterium]
MKLARFSFEERVAYGVVEGDRLFELPIDPFSEGTEHMLPGLVSMAKEQGTPHKLEDVRLLAPCVPSKIIAIGLNYKAHAAEFNKELPEEPMFFFKPPTSVVGPGDNIIYPSHMSHRVDFEAELAIVVGRQARNISIHDTRDYIFGYTCFNDVTARDLQATDKQYARAKGFDTFAPMGPWIETELDEADVKIESCLNGEARQSTSSSDMIFSAEELFSFVSHVMTLKPGDVIATGTPSGVGKMKPGDEIEIRIDGIGSLVNSVSKD